MKDTAMAGPQGPRIEGLVSRAVVLGGAVDLEEVGPSERSLGSWRCTF